MAHDYRVYWFGFRKWRAAEFGDVMVWARTQLAYSYNGLHLVDQSRCDEDNDGLTQPEREAFESACRNEPQPSREGRDYTDNVLCEWSHVISAASSASPKSP